MGIYHQCYIQPQKPSKPQTKLVFYNFKTRTHNNKHKANFVCTIDFKNKKCWASGITCINLSVQKFRQPKYRNKTFMAHSASGCDNNMLECIPNQGITPRLVWVLKMPRKSYSPHLFNTVENENYVGSYHEPYLFSTYGINRSRNVSLNDPRKIPPRPTPEPSPLYPDKCPLACAM